MSADTIPQATDILAAISGCGERDEHSYAEAFSARNVEQPNQGWDVLMQVFNFFLRPANASSPFGPMSEFGGRRSMPSDLTEPQLDALVATIEHIDDPTYRARVGDLIWL